MKKLFYKDIYINYNSANDTFTFKVELMDGSLLISEGLGIEAVEIIKAQVKYAPPATKKAKEKTHEHHH